MWTTVNLISEYWYAELPTYEESPTHLVGQVNSFQVESRLGKEEGKCEFLTSNIEAQAPKLGTAPTIIAR
jgi:hypothetical protein